MFIEKTHPQLSQTRQAELLGIGHSTLYYVPHTSLFEQEVMREIDRIYTHTPFYGNRRITEELRRKGFDVGRDLVRTCMHTLGLEALYPKPRTSTPHLGHQIYPYLLKGVQPSHSNHIWGTDITYIPLHTGWIYLVVIIDWFSRYILSWELSLSLDASFCTTCLGHALDKAQPEIHNSDQGSQFTSIAYTTLLKDHHIAISMDGRGRCFDNIFTERFWRSFKYEEVYLKDYSSVHEARKNIAEYITFYNHTRIHQSLDYKTPYEVYIQNL